MIGVPGFKAFLGGFLVGDAFLEFFVGDFAVMIGVAFLEASDLWIGIVRLRGGDLRRCRGRFLGGLTFLDAIGVLAGFAAERLGLFHEVFVARALMGGDEGFEFSMSDFGFGGKVGFLEG